MVKYYAFNGQQVAMKAGSTLTYLHGDHLVSTIMETNNLGATTTDEKYFAYGKQRDSGKVGTDNRFTGQKEDGSGLMYYGARFYDPQTGMFVSPDTIVPDAGLVSDYNRFAYARGNAIKYNDPTGHIVTGDCMCGGGSTFAEAQAYAYENAARTAANVGVSAVMATIAVANALDTNEGEKVTQTAPPALGPQPKPATQTGTQTWLPLSDGMDISIPGTSDAGFVAPNDPGATLTSPSPGSNVYTWHGQNTTIVGQKSSGRLSGYTEGTSDLSGGQNGAGKLFEQLTGRQLQVGNPASTAPTDIYIESGKLEVFFRPTSKSKTPVIEIIDHVAKTIEKIHFNN